MMVPQKGGYAGLCVRSNASVNALGLNLRIEAGTRCLRLYENGKVIAGQTRTVGSATAWALNRW